MTPRIAQLHEVMPAGAGIGLRRELWHETLDHADEIDFVEIIVDDYLDAPIRHVRQVLAPVLERFAVVAHGVRLSVASAEGVDEDYVDRVARLLDALGIEVYTEHLSFRRGGAHEVEQFVPVPFTERWAERVAENVRQVQQVTGRTIALENVTYLLGHPDRGIGEPAFVRHVAEEADCALLLDVTNLLINAANFDYSTSEYLETIPLDRVVAAHVAGGHDDGNFYIDSHSSRPPEQALRLLSRVASRSGLRTAALERDKAYPDAIDPLLTELSSIREAMEVEPADAGEVALPALRGTVEPPTKSPSEDVPEADRIPPLSLQRTLAEVLVQPGAFRALRAARAGSLGGDDGDVLTRYLLSFPPENVRAFRKILTFKRREKIESVLPGTFELLEDRLKTYLSDFFSAHPEQSRTRAEDGILFAEFVASRDDAPEPLRSMAAHEQAVLELKSRPFRFWQFLWRPTAQRTLTVHPRDLDQAIHHGAPVPPPEPEPFDVRYERRRQGVWVEVMNSRSPR